MRASSAAIASSAVASLWFALGASPAFAADPPAGAPKLPAETHTLPNGLRVVLAPDPELPEVAIVVRYLAGSADDPNGLEGLAHLTEHAYFARSRHIARGAFYRLLESAGATRGNRMTAPDDTTYLEVVPPSALGLAVWLEADRMASAGETVDSEVVDHERRIVGREYTENVVDASAGAFGQTIFNEVFPAWHPYHVQGDAAASLFTIGGAGVDDVRAFQRTWYSPANAVLALAGPFDPAQVMAVVTREFGPIAGTRPPARPALPMAWNTGDVLLDVRTSMTRDMVIEDWSTPAWHSPGDRELDIAASVLAGPGGTLVQSLVDRGLAVSAYARQASKRRGSMFGVSAVVADGADADEVRRIIEREISALTVHVDPAAVEITQRLWRRRGLARIETALGRATRLSQWYGDDDGDGDPWELDPYANITGEAVSKAVRLNLVPSNRVTAMLLSSKVPLPRGTHAYVEQRVVRERAP
jgi:predicted Zn-dependent peptidase